MKRTFVPQMGKSLSAIGLGCVTFGREIDPAASFSIMDFAQENSVSFFDTAPAYGAGASEKIVGAWLTSRKAYESIMVATKIQPPYEPKNILRSVSQSLKNLNTDTIDILYLHLWDPTIETTQALKTFNDLIIAGKIKMIGVSNFNPDQLRNVLRLQIDQGFECFRSVQNNNNLAVSDINEEFMQICVANDIEIVTYSPLGAGFLTGKYQHEMKEGTRFALIKGHQDIYFNETGFQRLQKLQIVSALTGYSSSHLALAWAMHRPGIASVLIGVRKKEQLSKALAALNFYDTKIFDALASISF